VTGQEKALEAGAQELGRGRERLPRGKTGLIEMKGHRDGRKKTEGRGENGGERPEGFKGPALMSTGGGKKGGSFQGT